MKRVGNATIEFRELHPYVFCDGYRVPKGSKNRYQLTFTTPDGKLRSFGLFECLADLCLDAIGFMEIFHRIRI
jgi:hypothetical protein